MERSIKKNALVNLLALVAVGVIALAVARDAGSQAGQVAVAFLGLGALVAFVSWFQMRLVESERLEKLELEELARTKGSATLFEARAAEVFPAQRAREQFERFFVPAFTVLLLLLQAGSAFLFWRWLGAKPGAVQAPMVGMTLFGALFLALFILGRFAAAFSRLENSELLRPGAGYVLLNAYLALAVAVGIGFVWGGFPAVDWYVAKGLCALLALIAVETLVTLVLEIYRPRVKGRQVRPVYESRLVSLLGQPEGLLTTAAHTLDYQFGFKVSETWFYRFFERALGWLILLQLGLLALSTCVVFIEPGEQALLERFGSPVKGRAVLGPGGHFKWPWPADKVYRYRTDRIQSFVIGSTAAEGPEERTVVWTMPHTKEEDNFLVANREPAAVDTNALPGGRRIPPVSLLAVSVPVQYQIRDVTAWAYHDADAAGVLQRLATSEVVRYLANVDLGDIMSRGRFEAAAALRGRIQAAADAHQLGANILFVGLEDVHPPVKVAPDYEKVVTAGQLKVATNLAARAYAIRTNALAATNAFALTNRAAADKTRLEVLALARAALFTNQIPAFNAAPSVYTERAYLQTFKRAVAGSRKYVLLTTNTADVVTFDLQERAIDLDLSRMTVAPPPRTK